MRRIDRLKKEAGESARTRGHVLGKWYGFKYESGKEYANNQCLECSAWVRVETFPALNSIDISGDALAIECKPKMFSPAPWRFDGHGINDVNGQRICKVQNSTPYTYPNGHAVRNLQFDRDSNLIKAAPDMFKALEMALRHVRKDAMEYDKGDHGKRVYVADEIRQALNRARRDD